MVKTLGTSLKNGILPVLSRILRVIFRILSHPGVILGSSWGHLGLFGVILAVLGAVLGSLGAIFGPSWGLLGLLGVT